MLRKAATLGQFTGGRSSGPPAPVRLSWACHLSWSHLETTLQSSGTFFFALATRWQYHSAVLCQSVSRGWIWQGRVNYNNIYTGSRGKAVAQLWSGRVIQQDRPIHVTALCWVWNP